MTDLAPRSKRGFRANVLAFCCCFLILLIITAGKLAAAQVLPTVERTRIKAGGVEWVVQVPTSSLSARGLKTAALKAGGADPSDAAAVPADFGIQPKIATREDLVRFALGALPHIEPDARFFQVVGGIPEHPWFDDVRFDPVRNGFSESCTSSARHYLGYALDLMSAAQPLVGSHAAQTSDSYESSCLVPLHQVPDRIRQVVGVLAIERDSHWVSFCSASITGPRQLTTAKHCFFDADSGEPTPLWEELLNGAVGFHPAVPHSGLDAFSVRAVDEGIDQIAYPPYEDRMHLRVLEGPFERYAAIEPVEPSTLPLPVWVVGSNGLLGDVARLRHPMEYVRASGPEACAILHTTRKQCLYHSCQTGPSTSGAGLLIDSASGPKLVGVHKGPLARAQGCEGGLPLDLDLNLAASMGHSTGASQ